MYYGPSGPPEYIDGRDDIDSPRYLLSPTLHEIALLGDSVADMTDTALLAVSHSVMNEMIVSSTPKTLENLAQRCGTTLDDDFARRLVERTDTIMTGMAQVGALRSIAWACSRGRLTALRPQIIRLARQCTRHVNAVGGYAHLVADDAHAHLRAAERIQVPAEGPAEEAARTMVLIGKTTGCTLLAMSFAAALVEPWNPFLDHRLSAELAEHLPTVKAASELDSTLGSQLEHVRAELDNLWRDTTAKWKSRVTRGQDDIAAYFDIRRQAPKAPAPTELSSVASALYASEPEIERYL